MADDNGGPGILQGIKAYAMAPLERAVAERKFNDAQRAQAENILSRFQEVARRVHDREDGWIPLLGGGVGHREELTEEDRTQLRNKARKADLRDPLIVGYRKSLMAYVMGEGVTLSADTGDEGTDEELDEWWARFKRVNGWDKLEDEIPHRTWRDGECFLQFFTQMGEGPIEGWEPSRETMDRLGRIGIGQSDLEPPTSPDGMVHVRLVRPEHVTDPQGVVSHGVVTSASDVQTVLGYIKSTDGNSAEFVDSSEMEHIKIRSDSDEKRGRTLYEPLLKRNSQYEDWLDYRLLLNLARTAVVLIKKMESASGSEVSNIRQQQQDELGQGGNRKQKMLKPMSTIHASGIDYEFKSPNLDAADAQKDGRSILLNMATATNLPEFMFSGDSSNANFASTLVSEGPAIKEFESWRDFFEPRFVKIYRRVMREAARANQIQMSADEAEQLEPAVEWPTMEVRDEKAHAQANQIRFMNGVISRRTWREDAGIDHEVEERRREEEQEADFDVTPPPEPEGDDEA